MADFDALQPVRTTAANFTTEVANASGTTINPAEDYAQASTTSGQNGILIQGAVTTSAPTYTTGQTNPLSLDTSGNLRVTITGSSSVTQGTTPWVDNISQWGGTATSLGQKTMSASVPVVIASDQSPINVQIGGVTPVVNFFTDVAVVSGSSVSHTVVGPAKIDEIWSSASGELKVVIAVGVSGSEATQLVGFTTASNKIMDWKPEDSISIPSGQDVKITLTNFDKQAMDTYLTVITH